MTRIKSLAVSHLRNDLHFQFFVEFCKLVAEIGAAALKVETLWPAFLQLFGNLDTALKKIVMSAETEKIHEADKIRDELYHGFVKMVAALCDHIDAATRNAAREVMVVIHTYGNVAAKSLNEETSAIYNMVQELKSDRYKDFVAQLNLTKWLGDIEIANNNCEAHVQERYRDNAGKSHIAVRDARRALDAAYHDIIDIINARLLLGQLEGCDAFVDTLNEVIRKFAVHTHRHKHGKHGAGADGADAAGEGAPTGGEA